MATLTVWKFSSAEGANDALLQLEEMQRQQLIDLQDGAVVSWPSSNKKPKTTQMRSTVATGALGGSFWGLLFGLIFFVPFLGLAIGAGIGALAGSLTDVGIDDDFISQVRDQVTPGTSALFLMTNSAVIEKVKANLTGEKPELIMTNLTDEQEQQLREAFEEE